MAKLIAALSAAAILGLASASFGQTTTVPSQGGATSQDGGCSEVGRTGCKPDASFGHSGTASNCEGRTGCGGTDTQSEQQGAVQSGCDEVGRTGCKPDSSFGHERSQTPGAPPTTSSGMSQ
jgi:hypothetical protein